MDDVGLAIIVALMVFTVCSVLTSKRAGTRVSATRVVRYMVAMATLAVVTLTAVVKAVAWIAEAAGKDDQTDFDSGIGGVYNHLTGRSEAPRGQLGVYDEGLNDYV